MRTVKRKKREGTMKEGEEKVKWKLLRDRAIKREREREINRLGEIERGREFVHVSKLIEG